VFGVTNPSAVGRMPCPRKSRRDVRQRWGSGLLGGHRARRGKEAPGVIPRVAPRRPQPAGPFVATNRARATVFARKRLAGATNAPPCGRV